MPVLARFSQPFAIPAGQVQHDVHASRQILADAGPLLLVTASLSTDVADPMVKLGLAVAPPEQGLALIDSGAGTSAIDEEMAIQLGLPIIDRGSVATPSHENHRCNFYPVHVSVPGSDWTFDITCFGAKIGGQGLLMLLGRDALRGVQFVYNGEYGFYTIAY